MIKRVLYILSTIFIIMVIYSCTDENFAWNKISKHFQLNPDIVLPLGYGTLSITDIVKESDSVRYNGDTIEIFLNRDSIATLSAADFFQLPDQSEQDMVFNLGNRFVYQDTVSKTIPLSNLITLTFPTQGAGLTDGTPLPAINPESSGDVLLDVMNSFDSIEIASGTMDMTLENNLTGRITNMQINIRNVDDDGLIASYVFTDVDPGASQIQSADMTGVILQNETYAELVSIQTQAGGPISLSNNNITIILQTNNLKALKGRAILPDQVFDSREDSLSLNLDAGERITVLEIDKGYMRFTLQSYIEEKTFLHIVLPNTRKNNIPIDTSILVNEMSAGATVDSINLAGTVSDVENNKIPGFYTTSLVSSGQMVDFDFSDSLNYSSTVERVGITIKSAQGYFGSDIVNINTESFENNLDLFTNFEGSFELTDPEIIIKYTNSYGLPIDIDLAFTGEYDDGTMVNLGTPTIVFQYPLTVNDPPVENSVKFDKNNLPEIVDFLKFPPADRITYYGTATSNPDGPSSRDNFIHNQSDIVIGMELKFPLEIRANNISLRDTIKLDGFNVDEEESNNKEGGFETTIEEASMAYRLRNGFPLDMKFTVILYDSISDIQYDTIDIGQIEAAPVDNNGIVIPVEVEAITGNITLTETILDHIKYNSNKLIIIGNMNTTKNNNGDAVSVKILTTYKIEFNAGLRAKILIKKRS